jgi:hypothetical protein
MSLNNITSSQLRKLIPIVERREILQGELADIESQLWAYLSPEPTTATTRGLRKTRKSMAVREVIATKPKVRHAEAKSTSLPQSAQRRGKLKELILAALQKAGSKGLAIKDLAAALKVKSQNLHVWFSSTGKNVKGVTKVGAGRWKYNHS